MPRFQPLGELETDQDLIGIGLDLEPETILTAYRSGYFPMPIDDSIGWFAPRMRAVVRTNSLHVSRSTKKSARQYSVTCNQAWNDVIAGCADPDRPHGWISKDISEAFTELFSLGWAHSVEVWTEQGDLAGGLYGIGISSMFFGESMFHRHSNASKVAVTALCDSLASQDSESLLDAQWLTPHLSRLGFTEVTRSKYARLLDERTSTGRKLTLPKAIGLDLN